MNSPVVSVGWRRRLHTSRRGIFALALLSLVAARLAAAAAPSPKPNILWLIIEDVCPDFGCYGTPAARTPNIDRFAAEARLFRWAFATGSVCSPARSAFMTGRYQTSFGAQNHRSHRNDGLRRPPEVRLITERMRAAGYFNVNVRSLPREPGFTGTAKTDWNFYDDGKAFDSDKWSDLKAHQPFYAQLNFAPTHRPYRKAQHDATDPAKVRLPDYLPDDPVIRADWAAYLDELASVDAKIGAVLDLLERDGLRENTAVFLFGDQGREDFRGKYYAYEQGFHVPLIVRWPALLPAGTTSDDLVSLLDVHATSLALAGIDTSGLDGWPTLAPGSRTREYLFGARDRIDETPDRVRTVRDARYKYIRNFEPERPYLQPMAYAEVTNPTYNRMRQLFAAGALNAPQAKFMAERRPSEELYDLKQDPFELRNLASEPSARDTLARLRGTLAAWMRDTGDQGGAPEDPEMIRIEMERLDNSVRRTRAQASIENAPAIDGPPTTRTTRGLILFSDSLAGSPLTASWTATAGDWSPVGGATRGSASAATPAATLRCGPPFGDAILHGEVRRRGDSGAGIQISGAAGTETFVGVDREGLVVRRAGGQAIRPAPGSTAAHDDGWHAIVVEIIGDALIATLDGQVTVSAPRPARDGDLRLSLRSERGAADFRNVRIWGATIRPVTSVETPQSALQR